MSASGQGSALGFPLGGDSTYWGPRTRFDQSPGADVSLLRRSDSGRFDIQWDAVGNPIFTDDQSHAVLSLIYAAKGKWWADQSRSRGSYLYSVKEIRRATPSKLRAYIEDAIRPLIDARRIFPPRVGDLVSVSKDPFNINRMNVTVNYTLPGGLAVVLRPAIGF